jgi:hypothetical protein
MLSWRGQIQIFALILDYFYNFVYPSLLLFSFVSRLTLPPPPHHHHCLFCPVCSFVSAILVPLYNINLCLVCFTSSFLLNFVLCLCVFSLSISVLTLFKLPYPHYYTLCLRLCFTGVFTFMRSYYFVKISAYVNFFVILSLFPPPFCCCCSPVILPLFFPLF